MCSFDVTNQKWLLTVYEGNWLKNQKSGVGVLTKPDGSRYEGQFLHDLQHGKGVVFWNDKKFCEGNWVQGKYEGHCVMTYSNGNKFDGHFVKGLRNGQGTFQWSDGQKYVGNWKDEVPSGFGTKYDEKGEVVFSGQWLGGREQRESKC